MREKLLIQAVNRPLPKTLHHQSMTGASMTMNGIPDRYYDGSKRDGWIEFKQRDSMPRSGLVGGVDNKKDGCYRTLQFDWMRRRWSNCIAAGVTPNVFGIIGLPNKTAVIQTTPTEWEHGSSISGAVSYKEISAWITAFFGP